MMLALIIPAAVAALVVIPRLKGKKKVALKEGDYVMLKRKFEKEYPGVPASHALKIEYLKEDKAVVVYISTNGKEINKKELPLITLVKAG